jgi:hypothetical protein
MTAERLRPRLHLWSCRLVAPLLAVACSGPGVDKSQATATSGMGSSVPGSSGSSGATSGSGTTNASAGGTPRPSGAPDADAQQPGMREAGTPPPEADAPDTGNPPGVPEGGGGPPGACNHLLCESFEAVAVGSPPDPAIWTATSNDIVVDGTRAALGGKKALHIPPLTAGVKYIRENKTIAAMGKSFYGRVFFWIEQQPIEKPGSLYHWTLLSADELTDYNAGKVLRLGGHIEGSGTNWVRFNFQTHNNPGETGLSDPQLVLSTKRWYCAEFYYSLQDNEARIWLDGVEDQKLHWKGPMGGYAFPTAVTWMTFGWAEYQAARTPWEIWIDEIAIDTKPIGCN